MDSKASANMIDQLCTQCGLCCDGTLFADVELEDESEEAVLESMGLAIDTDGPPVLLQPCMALDGTRCTVYEHRPGCCRTFECRLLQRVQRRQITPEDALRRVAEARSLAVELNTLCLEAGEVAEELPLKERAIEVLAGPIEVGDDQAGSLRTKIASTMDALGQHIHEHFMGD